MAKLAIKGGVPLCEASWPAWPEAGQREKELLCRVIDSNLWSYNGPMETEFKSKWSDFTGIRHSLLVANGTVSLQLILEGLEIGVGDEVIVPGLTWQADAAAVIDVNAVPVLVDIEEDSWCIDPDKIEKAITARTKAIIAVHLYGTICDIERITAIARRHKLYVIEDCAHQHGSRFKGKHIGAFGDAGSFSLQNSKVFTCGEGGIIVTEDSKLAYRLDALRNCGRRSENVPRTASDFEHHSLEGDLVQSGNYRITEFQAAILLAQLERLQEQVIKRDKNACYLNGRLAEIEGVRPLSRREGTEVQSYFNFAFRYDKRYFKGLDVTVFREALSKELNFEFEACYEPLEDCSLYRPLTKKRHALASEYLAAIDPSRFDLPVCRKAYSEESVNAHHRLLLEDTERCDRIVDAVLKIKENIDEIA